MLSSLGLRLALLGLLALGTVTGISLGYRHYTGLLSTIRVLEANEANLRIAHEVQADTIDAQSAALGDWELAQEAWVATVASMQDLTTAARAENRRLNDIFSKHDLGLLALAKPGRVEKIVNDGTADTLRMRECASGAAGEKCTDDGGDANRAPQPPDPGPD